MPMLTPPGGAAGVAAITDAVNNLAPVKFNPDPTRLASSGQANTVYVWADTWGSASVQIFISPTTQNSAAPAPWFPVGDAITQNGFITFDARWGSIKAEISAATSATANLNVQLFDPAFSAGFGLCS